MHQTLLLIVDDASTSAAIVERGLIIINNYFEKFYISRFMYTTLADCGWDRKSFSFIV